MKIFKSGDIIRADDINSNFEECYLETGTIMLFAQRYSPTKWTKQNIIDDAAIRITSSDNSGGSVYGSTDFSVMFSSSFKLPVSGNMGETTLTIEQMPSHSHSLVHRRFNGGESANISALSNFASYIKNANTGLTGGSMSHSHSVSGDFTVDLSIKYIDVILCKKN